MLLALCMTVCLFPTEVWAVQDSTAKSAKTNFGLTDEKVNYVYLNSQGAYKSVLNNGGYPHFIESGSGIYHIHGSLKFDSVPNLNKQRPNNIEVKAGGTVKLLFDGTLEGDEGLVWDYSALSQSTANNLTEEYSLIKVKNGSQDKPTNLEIHFAGKVTLYAPVYNAAVHTYGDYSNVTLVLHDDCDVTIKGGAYASAVGGVWKDDGKGITIKTDGKYDESGRRISNKNNGKLTCIGGYGASGIGGGFTGGAQRITIEGGDITAKGGYGASGIGAGVFYEGERPELTVASDIQINGGTVHAEGNYGASGIGGGYYYTSSSAEITDCKGVNARNIRISGGEVYATGGKGASGIGGSYVCGAENISVTGGKVTASAGDYASAIGGGAIGTAKNISFSGGNIIMNAKSKNSDAYLAGQGNFGQSNYSPSHCKSVNLSVPDNCKAILSVKVFNVSDDAYRNVFYSLDGLDLNGMFKKYIIDGNVALQRAEINFEVCNDHSLKWAPNSGYSYCTKCQSVKAYDDIAPSIEGIDDTVLTGSWVNFSANDLSGASSKDITHRYYVGDEERSVVFRSVPYTKTGIEKVTVATYTYDPATRTHSVLSNEEALTETADADGKKSYKFKGANAYNEYTNFKNATTSEGKSEALKMQRITVTDKAGNTVSRDVYAILSHRIECYIGTEKQIIDRENARDYLEVINGSNLKLTYLHENASAALGYQYFYYVTVNGTHIPTTDDDIYKFNNIQEDLEIHFDPAFDETAPLLSIKINGQSYDSTQTGNDDLSKLKKLNTSATVSLSAADVDVSGAPTSGIMNSSLEYIISERPLTALELENSTEWQKYNGAFTLPDSKISFVYARVKDIAKNITYAASVPYYPDETQPIFEGLRDGDVYCGEVRFGASDAGGILQVKAGETVITPDDDGMYTLAAGTGTVTVTVTDNNLNTASVTVTVNSGHTPQEDDGNCTTAVNCSVCGIELIAAESGHSFPDEWTSNRPGTMHSRCCENEGCNITQSRNCTGDGNASCTTLERCTVCGGELGSYIAHDYTAEIPDEQYLMTAATCTESAVYFKSCSVCGVASGSETFVYGDPTGHSYGEWTPNGDGTHTRICENDATHIESDDCFDGDNDHCCDACGNAVSTHSGGTATCSERAKCELCGERYGELNPNNHADLKRVSEKAATTEADGNIEYWYCSECNRYFSDSQATREISQSDTVTAKLPKPVESSELPKTGSGSKLARWVWLSLASGGALGLTAAFERKERKTKC